MPLGTRGLIHPKMLATVAVTAEQSWTGHGQVARPGTGPGTYNPGTGRNDPPQPTPLHEPASVRVQARPANERVVQVGQQAVSVRTYEVHGPLAWTELREGDVLTLDACDDPYLVGRPLTVIDVQGSTLPVERVFVVQDRIG